MRRITLMFPCLACSVVLVWVLGSALMAGDEAPPAASSSQQGAAGASEDSPAGAKEPLRLSDEPLRLSDEPPLLLDDNPLEGRPDAEMADNSRCHVCHLNFAMEELATVHAREKIGCADCHGNCDAHIDDESWASGGPGTPPEIMYPPEKIDPACQKCHHSHDAPAAEVIARWRQRCPQKTDPEQIVCTDCHGHHRVKSELRKAWWDKRTGKPIKPPHLEQQSQAE